jgi:hypothetical protein
MAFDGGKGFRLVAIWFQLFAMSVQRFPNAILSLLARGLRLYPYCAQAEGLGIERRKLVLI